ncbi:MAG TPA: sialidase family protein, partial [Candidatus Bathyarchaeia archaeon]|nr:sialidase family protein [Candidatus Bathyarchaeia archaeon]
MSKLGVVAILVASILGTVPARAGLESRGQNFPLEVPTPEFSPSSLLGVTSAQDESVVVHGEADGELVMITQQNRSLWAATSSDNGATFSPEVRIAGVPTEGPIDAFRFVATVDALYVAYLVGDPGGDVGLSIRRSMDMGRTWSPPTAIVARGSLRHGINDLRLHANDAGRVAVMFDGLWEDRDVWVTVSSDQGSTWTTPVHLDVTTATQSVVGDIEVGSGGTVHAAIVRQPTSRVFYTRSTDGGLTFAPEISLASIAGGLDTVVPDIVTYPNNTVLVAFWDRSSGSTDKVDVVRSTNDGLSFVATATKTVPSVGSNPRMRLVGAPNFGDAVLAYVTAGELRTSLSQNTGASFDWDAVVGTNVDTFEITRTAANQYVLAWNDTGWMPGVYAALSVDGGFSWGVPKRADQGPGATAESRMGGVTIAGTDRAFFAYLDRRDDLETQMNVYAVDATVGAFDFTGRERRVDTDPAGWDANLITQGGFFASDGASNVYVAIYVNAEEHGNELWVSRSGDGGRTYQPIHKVSTHAPSSFEVEYARIRALPDGRVYVSWLRRDPATSQVFLIFARSTDFGATWGPETVLAGPLVNTQTHLLEATPTAVVAIWEDNNHISIRRSIDGGATFSPASNLDANPGTFSQFPVACSQGSRMLVAYAAADGLGLNPWVRISADSGATW